MKVLRTHSTNGPNQPDEGELLQLINTADVGHPGNRHIVKLLDSFLHTGPNGQHPCLVFETLGESLYTMLGRTPQRSLPLNTVKSIARQTLLALEYLHVRCKLIHTGETWLHWYG